MSGLLRANCFFLALPLLLLAVAFILSNLDTKFSKEFRTEILNIEYVSDRLAKSALNRTQTAACKVQLRHFLSDIASKAHWPVKEVNNNCSDLFEIADLYLPVGCFRDLPSDPSIRVFISNLSAQNSPSLCVQRCLRAGFRFAGTEFGGLQCFCWPTHAETLFKNRTISSSPCDHSLCAGDGPPNLCGRDPFGTISVYRTGVRDPFAPSSAFDNSMPNLRPFRSFGADGSDGAATVQILFLLQLNGRDSRQIRRLLRLIFLPRHFYFVHVDIRYEFMLKEMLKVEQSLKAKGFSNFRVAKRRMATIWGGSTLLDLFLWIVAETLGGRPNSKWAQWDYIVNLSETDMSILSVEELEQYLARKRGFSFLKSHGHDTAAFLQKQGLHFHFMQCEQRMWRVAERHNFPDNIRLDGGSDWVVVHRDLALFAISDSVLPSQMRQFFSSVLLPLESFFHTLALNSDSFCRRVIYRNLRFTNWRRRQGCRCAPLRPVVDWCGCSPLAMRANELDKLALNVSQSKFHFFGRKFDSAVDVAPIAFAERQSLRFRADSLLTSQSAVASSSSHWLNMFSSLSPFDSPFGMNSEALLTRFTALTVRFMLPNKCMFHRLNDLHFYKEFSLAPSQTIATFSAEFGRSRHLFQALIALKRDFPSPTAAVRRPTADSANSTVSHRGSRFLFNTNEGIAFGLGFDHKEEIFRTYPPLISASSKFTFKWRWKRLVIGADVNAAKWTSPPVELFLHTPNGDLFQRVLVPPYDSVFGTQFAEFELGRFLAIPPGIWSIALYANDSLQNSVFISSISFPIFSDALSIGEWDNERLVIDHFFFVRDICAVADDSAPLKEPIDGQQFANLTNCSELLWSSLFLDEKSVFPPAAPFVE